MGLRVEERIVAGQDVRGLVVHHLVLRGGNRAIGRHLGELVRARYGVRPAVSPDPLRLRAQREWLRRNAPVQHERLLGVADAFGAGVDDAVDTTRLGMPPAVPGCSAMFLPAPRAASGHPLVSRAFDFAGPVGRPPPGASPSAGRPYLVELYPDSGYPSLAVCAFDLAGAALDGVNAEGLVVVAASEVESAAAGALEPGGPGVGLDELQVVRHLLDTCATAAEAREALLSAKLYYAAHPAHWLVADRGGDAFVFEVSLGRNRVHVVEARGEPLVATNHLLHRHPPGAPLPRSVDPAGTFARYRALASGLAEAPGPLDEPGIAALAARAFVSPDGEGPRTLWHVVYDAAERRLSARFFLVEPGERGGAPEVRVQLS